ncbi:MAG: hypothetical protein DMG77_12985 [Acidobacteria bacterium]|nr:MAG: hypothetical protein DMG77_12985 [Acidobacteriota bacterium]
MRNLRAIVGILVVFVAAFYLTLYAQDGTPAPRANDQNASRSAADPKDGRAFSGMYSFLKDGEFVQVTVEDDGHVTGFISRYGEGQSDKGAFLDQFFKSGKLDGNKLSFTTDTVHGVWFEFKGTIERGEGKNPGDEAYYVLKGTLTQNSTDVDKKVSSQTRDVLFKVFPQDAGPAPAARN